MRTKQQIIEQLLNPGIIAVVRAKRTDQAVPIAEALVAGGVIAVEITMTTPDAIAAIRDATAKLGDRALIGVGTVLVAVAMGPMVTYGLRVLQYTPPRRPTSPARAVLTTT